MPSGESQPVLVRLGRVVVVDFLNQTLCQLLSKLHQVASQQLDLVSVSRRSVERVERKAGISGDGKVLDSSGVQQLVGLVGRGGGLELAQTFGHKENAVDECSVGGALDLKVLEKGVCSEQIQHLVDDVVVGVAGIAGASERRFDGQNGKVSHYPGVLVLAEKCTVQSWHFWVVLDVCLTFGDALRW